MIKINNNKAIMEFGLGDIAFKDYKILGEDENKDERGLVFYSYKPREIGSFEVIHESALADKEKVQMIFRNTESIDVLIDALIEVRGMFNENTLDLGYHFECDICGDMCDVDEINITDDGDELCHSCFDDLISFLGE